MNTEMDIRINIKIFPGEKTLERLNDNTYHPVKPLENEKIQLIRKIVKGKINVWPMIQENLPSYRVNHYYYNTRYHDHVDMILELVNVLIGGYGVEPIRSEYTYDRYYGDCIALFVNLGDTYDTTLLYDVEKDKFYVTSWGDWYEQTKYCRLEQEKDY